MGAGSINNPEKKYHLECKTRDVNGAKSIVDTMKLNGKYFKSHVTNESQVNLGDLLLEFDIDSLKKNGFNLITPIIVTNIDNYIKAVPMFSEKDEVQILDNILTIV